MFEASKILMTGHNYARLQTKTADLMGPLGALWSKLDEVRRGGEDEIDVADLLRLAVCHVARPGVCLLNTPA